MSGILYIYNEWIRLLVDSQMCRNDVDVKCVYIINGCKSTRMPIAYVKTYSYIYIYICIIYICGSTKKRNSWLTLCCHLFPEPDINAPSVTKFQSRQTIQRCSPESHFGSKNRTAKGVLERNTVSFPSFIRQFEHQRSTGYRFETTAKEEREKKEKKKKKNKMEEGEERFTGDVSPPHRSLLFHWRDWQRQTRYEIVPKTGWLIAKRLVKIRRTVCRHRGAAVSSSRRYTFCPCTVD